MTATTSTVHGTVAPDHEPVRDAFAENVARRDETGAACAAGLGDAGRRVGFACTMTAMFGDLTGDPRPRAVLDAPAGCLP